MTNFYNTVLDKYQQSILPQLSFLTNDGFYLAGGTALSIQIGHRTSVDFDFLFKSILNLLIL
ncbi:MAG TPA: nucleotidyl transferase AbiEii/AbiGii toxin family protein [Patescibacteria group bacterium]|nr:nucleotidyl transferase AbiEii/AbiGii toxin family protein [Patescibacteria group bacterium]